MVKNVHGTSAVKVNTGYGILSLEKLEKFFKKTNITIYVSGCKKAHKGPRKDFRYLAVILRYVNAHRSVTNRVRLEFFCE